MSQPAGIQAFNIQALSKYSEHQVLVEEAMEHHPLPSFKADTFIPIVAGNIGHQRLQAQPFSENYSQQKKTTLPEPLLLR